MEYTFNNNGIEICARYSDREIDEIFIPLLKHLSDLQDKKNSRLLVMLAAPPGAGKSTLSSFLEFLSRDAIAGKKVQAIGMDGFHRRQEYLTSHTTIVDGREVLMVDIKGAPVTFDFDRLKEKTKEMLSVSRCGWPVYNRLLHNPVEDAVYVNGDIIILEGNYLLLDEDGWRNLSDMADYTISIKADPEMLKKRLVERKISTGSPEEKAVKFVEFSDMANVRLCLEKTKPADLELDLSEENGIVTNCVTPQRAMVKAPEN
ncbi:MAG: nucleoside/nucleotide kinase family protein [Lachnospiraceae bacterium]|nr:nucleoside/nucleotide kinase family protein [Lachnospiraceae bacterium]